MNDIEFEVMDELYFIHSFEELEKKLALTENDLKDTLLALWQKGWIRVFRSIQSEIAYQADTYKKNFRNYYYIASKAGLLAHNGRA
ncbi:MAG: transporter [Candidatus Cyclobacteriaceae bacterium M3_2C_046]